MKIYRTRTQEEYDWLMQKLEGEGYKWNSEAKPTEIEEGREYANEIVIYLEANKKLTWDFVKYVDGKNISHIIEVSELTEGQSKYKIGDKIEFVEDYVTYKKGDIAVVADVDLEGVYFRSIPHRLDKDGYCFFSRIRPYNQYKTDAEVMRDIINGRNSKPHDPVNRPTHYENDGRDLFDEWHERYYNDSKTYTGKEVFAEIMKAVAERYIRRYPNKNAEDIDKGIYTLSRLKEYEENAE